MQGHLEHIAWDGHSGCTYIYETYILAHAVILCHECFVCHVTYDETLMSLGGGGGLCQSRNRNMCLYSMGRNRILTMSTNQSFTCLYLFILEFTLVRVCLNYVTKKKTAEGTAFL